MRTSVEINSGATRLNQLALRSQTKASAALFFGSIIAPIVSQAFTPLGTGLVTAVGALSGLELLILGKVRPSQNKQGRRKVHAVFMAIAASFGTITGITDVAIKQLQTLNQRSVAELNAKPVLNPNVPMKLSDLCNLMPANRSQIDGKSYVVLSSGKIPCP